MAGLVQTIAVMDKSGKAVSTVSNSYSPFASQIMWLIQTKQSKQLISIYKEAKAAYRERKAEVVAGHHWDLEEKHARKTIKGAPLDDNRPAPSRTHSRSHHDSHRPSLERRSTSGSVRRSDVSSIYPASHNRHSGELRSPRSPHSPSFQPDALTRRHSARGDDVDLPRPGALQTRAMTSPLQPSHHEYIDMDLAYGPIPPPLPLVRQGEEAEMKSLVQTVKRILEEADCLQYSASAIITSLQKNPDAMAAVALTLAEISNIARKMAPGALMAMKGSSPAVFALLASPQFLIAGGVAVGVTIVAFGGYKIIKKLQAKNAMQVEGMDEMMEIGGDVGRIDNWRRGIAEVEDQSVGTSAEGEFITPAAFAMSKLDLNEGRSSELRRKEMVSVSKKASSTSSSKRGSEKSDKKSSRFSSRSSSRSSEKTSSKGSEKKEKKEKRASKPSPLRLMLTSGHGSTAS